MNIAFFGLTLYNTGLYMANVFSYILYYFHSLNKSIMSIYRTMIPNTLNITNIIT